MQEYFITLRTKQGKLIEVSLKGISPRHAEFRALILFPESIIVSTETVYEIYHKAA